MSADQEPKCAKCAFYIARAHSFDCRVNAPSAFVRTANETVITYWPQPAPDAWCGRWKRRELREHQNELAL